MPMPMSITHTHTHSHSHMYDFTYISWQNKFLNKLKINVLLIRMNVNGNKRIMRRIYFMNIYFFSFFFVCIILSLVCFIVYTSTVAPHRVHAHVQSTPKTRVIFFISRFITTHEPCIVVFYRFLSLFFQYLSIWYYFFFLL